MAGGRSVIAEHREMFRRVIQAGQLQAGVELGPLAMIIVQGLRIAGDEIGPHGDAAVRLDDPDKPPWLGIADRRSQA